MATAFLLFDLADAGCDRWPDDPPESPYPLQARRDREVRSRAHAEANNWDCRPPLQRESGFFQFWRAVPGYADADFCKVAVDERDRVLRAEYTRAQHKH
jgi:hypothetical protein